VFGFGGVLTVTKEQFSQLPDADATWLEVEQGFGMVECYRLADYRIQEVSGAMVLQWALAATSEPILGACPAQLERVDWTPGADLTEDSISGHSHRMSAESRLTLHVKRGDQTPKNKPGKPARDRIWFAVEGSLSPLHVKGPRLVSGKLQGGPQWVWDPSALKLTLMTPDLWSEAKRKAVLPELLELYEELALGDLGDRAWECADCGALQCVENEDRAWECADCGALWKGTWRG
jgi:hypothetical protein